MKRRTAKQTRHVQLIEYLSGLENHTLDVREKKEQATLLNYLQKISISKMAPPLKMCFFKEVFSPEKPLASAKIVEIVNTLKIYFDLVDASNEHNLEIAKSLVSKMHTNNRKAMDAFYHFFLEYFKTSHMNIDPISNEGLMERLTVSIQEATVSFLDTTVATALGYVLDVLFKITEASNHTYSQLLASGLNQIIAKMNSDLDAGKKNANIYLYRHWIYERAIRAVDTETKSDYLNYYLFASDEIRHSGVYNNIESSIRRLNSSFKIKMHAFIELINIFSNEGRTQEMFFYLTECCSLFEKTFNHIDELLSLDNCLETFDVIFQLIQNNGVFVISQVDNFNDLLNLKNLMNMQLVILNALHKITENILNIALDRLTMTYTDFQKKQVDEIMVLLKDKANNHLFKDMNVNGLRENINIFRSDNYIIEDIVKKINNHRKIIHELFGNATKMYSDAALRFREYVALYISEKLPEHLFKKSEDNTEIEFFVEKKYMSKYFKQQKCPLYFKSRSSVILDLSDDKFLFNDLDEIDNMLEQIIKAYTLKLEYVEGSDATKSFYKKQEEEMLKKLSLNETPKKEEKGSSIDVSEIINPQDEKPKETVQSRKIKRCKNPLLEEVVTVFKDPHILKKEQKKEKVNIALLEATALLKEIKNSDDVSQYILTPIFEEERTNPTIVAVNRHLKDSETRKNISNEAQSKINSVSRNLGGARKEGTDGIKYFDQCYYFKIKNAGGQSYREKARAAEKLKSGGDLVIYDTVTKKKHMKRKLK